MAGLRVTREQVLAYRVAAQGLHRDVASVDELDVLDLGVQDAMGQPAGYAFSARLTSGADSIAFGPGTELVLAWSYRGAPHVHRRTEVNDLAAALWPMSEADATGRLNETGPSIKRSGIPALEQWRLTVDAMRSVVTSSIAKGAASTAVTAALPAVLGRECRPCRTRHVSDSAMRSTALAAGVELEPDTAPPVLTRRVRPRKVGTTDVAVLRRLAASYLHLLGPAGPGEVADYLGVRRSDLVERAWSDELTEVDVDRRRAWIPSADATETGAARYPDLVRLLGPFDPYLQARDRALLVPDKSLHKILWPVLGRPGALLVDGEIAGTWRTKSTKSKLTVTVEAFAGLPASRWRSVESEAERIARVRGVATVNVVRKP